MYKLPSIYPKNDVFIQHTDNMYKLPPLVDSKCFLASSSNASSDISKSLPQTSKCTKIDDHSTSTTEACRKSHQVKAAASTAESFSPKLSESESKDYVERLKRINETCVLLVNALNTNASSVSGTKSQDKGLSHVPNMEHQTTGFGKGELDIAIHADPMRPPLAFLASVAALKSLEADAKNCCCQCCLVCYTHSSSFIDKSKADTALRLAEFFSQEFSYNSNCNVENTSPKLSVRVIWKPTPVDCQVFVNAFTMTPLYGEVLGFKVLLAQAGLELPMEFEKLLASIDSAILISNNPNFARERNTLMKRLAGEALLHSSPTRQTNKCLTLLVDAFILGALFSAGALTAEKSLPENLDAWRSSVLNNSPCVAKLLEFLKDVSPTKKLA